MIVEETILLYFVQLNIKNAVFISITTIFPRLITESWIIF